MASHTLWGGTLVFHKTNHDVSTLCSVASKPDVIKDRDLKNNMMAVSFCSESDLPNHEELSGLIKHSSVREFMASLMTRTALLINLHVGPCLVSVATWLQLPVIHNSDLIIEPHWWLWIKIHHIVISAVIGDKRSLCVPNPSCKFVVGHQKSGHFSTHRTQLLV